MHGDQLVKPMAAMTRTFCGADLQHDAALPLIISEGDCASAGHGYRRAAAARVRAACSNGVRGARGFATDAGSSLAMRGAERFEARRARVTVAVEPFLEAAITAASSASLSSGNGIARTRDCAPGARYNPTAGSVYRRPAQVASTPAPRIEMNNRVLRYWSVRSSAV